MAATSQTQFAAFAPSLAPFHRPELDVLRFAAFSLVFLHHALAHESAGYSDVPRIVAQVLAAIGRAGALGVDLFFALSAYLITELLLREKDATGRIDVRAFYARRILRIWPLYFVVLLILAPLMGAIYPDEVTPRSYLAAFLLLAGNWACAVWGYPTSSFALLWSVSIEEQFYLVWPWLIRANHNRIRSVAFAMLALATVTRLILAANGTLHPGVWCNTLARLDPIAGGALLAFSLRGKTPKSNIFLLAAGLLGLLATGGTGMHDGWASLLSYPLAAASAVAVLYGTLGLGLDNAMFVWLGKVSYGLYVFHVAALRVAPNAIAGLALTIAAAAISYRLLETPFLRLKERFAKI
jgi:peptidoglycan/LPS O-acetylase OafA/YrhL